MSNLWDVKAVAEYLAISASTVYRYAEKNELPHIKKKFGLRFKKEDIDEFLERDKKEVISHTCLTQANLMLPPISLIDSGGVCEMARKSKSKTRLTFDNGVIFTRKTKSGSVRFYIEFYNSNEKRTRKVIKNARTVEEAKAALDRETQKAHDVKYGIIRKEKIRFEEFSEIYIRTYAVVKKRSWRTDQMYLKAQLIPFFGEMELSEITLLHVNKFIAKRKYDKVKNSTTNRELTVLKKMLGLAIEWNYEIERNPVKKGNFFSEEEYKRNRVLTYEEEKRLFRAAAPHLRSILTCALSTGMRYAEILGLKWENVDLEKQQILIKAECSKSGKSRVIPINASLLLELVKLKKLNKGRNKFVFLYDDPKTKKLRSVKTVRRAFVMACKRANIKNLTFHDLRHALGSRLIDKGADPVTVKNILGHASLKTTEIYLHSSLKQMKDAVALLDGKIDKKTEKLGNLSRICPTGKKEKREKFTSALFSAN